jgi:murein L,D-transpeptidase YcbB/YkuD
MYVDLFGNETNNDVETNDLKYQFVVNRNTYMMDVIIEDEVVLQSKVIVGRKGRTTPLLSSTIKNIKVNPRWNVPKSIRKDVVRKIQNKKNPISYIEKMGYYFIDNDNIIDPNDIDWKNISSTSFDYTIKQKPGKYNALGEVMFNIDKSTGIQLHGTATPSLFNKEKRTLSSGCIRVERINEIAQIILTNEGKSFNKLLAHTDQWIRLDYPISIKVID